MREGVHMIREVKSCDCVCHKLGYVFCGGVCPDHPLWHAAELELADDYVRNDHQ